MPCKSNQNKGNEKKRNNMMHKIHSKGSIEIVKRN